MDEAIRLDPKGANSYAMRALTYTMLGKYIDAQRDVDRAVELGIDRGGLEATIGELKKIRPFISERKPAPAPDAIPIDETDPAEALNNRGVAYKNLRQYQRAIEDYDEAMHRPWRRRAFANRALAYTLLGNDKEAQQDVDRAVELCLDRGAVESAIGELKKHR